MPVVVLAGLAVIAVVIALAIRGGGVVQPGLGATGEPEAGTIVTPERRDIRSVLVLDAVVAARTPVEVLAPAAGTVTLARPPGEEVAAADRLAVIDTDTGPVTVPAGVAGVVAAAAADGRTVAVGDVLATVAPSRFDIIAQVEPAQQYRLFEPPIAIVASIERGPAPFECPFLSIGSDPGAGSPFDAPVLLRCEVPLDVRVFAGVRVRLGVTTGQARGVLTLPVEAVAGLADRGYVTVVGPDGRRERRDVELGLTDGVNVEIVAGLAGDERVASPPDLSTP